MIEPTSSLETPPPPGSHYFVADTVCQSSAHDATLKIGANLSPLYDVRIQTSLIFMQHVEGTKFCPRNRTFLAKMGMSHEENCRCNMSPVHDPWCVPAFKQEMFEILILTATL